MQRYAADTVDSCPRQPRPRPLQPRPDRSLISKCRRDVSACRRLGVVATGQGKTSCDLPIIRVRPNNNLGWQLGAKGLHMPRSSPRSSRVSPRDHVRGGTSPGLVLNRMRRFTHTAFAVIPTFLPPIPVGTSPRWTAGVGWWVRNLAASRLLGGRAAQWTAANAIAHNAWRALVALSAFLAPPTTPPSCAKHYWSLSSDHV